MAKPEARTTSPVKPEVLVVAPIYKPAQEKLEATYTTHPYWNAADRAAALGQLGVWLERGLLQHRIGATLPLAQIVHAHQRVEAGGSPGNVVIEIG